MKSFLLFLLFIAAFVKADWSCQSPTADVGVHGSLEGDCESNDIPLAFFIKNTILFPPNGTVYKVELAVHVFASNGNATNTTRMDQKRISLEGPYFDTYTEYLNYGPCEHEVLRKAGHFYNRINVEHINSSIADPKVTVSLEQRIVQVPTVSVPAKETVYNKYLVLTLPSNNGSSNNAYDIQFEIAGEYLQTFTLAGGLTCPTRWKNNNKPYSTPLIAGHNNFTVTGMGAGTWWIQIDEENAPPHSPIRVNMQVQHKYNPPTPCNAETGFCQPDERVSSTGDSDGQTWIIGLGVALAIVVIVAIVLGFVVVRLKQKDGDLGERQRLV